jgi:hypothetical protein
MPHHVFTTLSRGVAIDQRSHTATLYSVIEQIIGPKLPFAFFEFSVLTLWSRLPGEDGLFFTQRTKIRSPQGAEILNIDCEFQLTQPRHRMIGTARLVPFAEAGYYQVETYLKARDGEFPAAPVHRYPVEVVIQAVEDVQVKPPSV